MTIDPAMASNHHRQRSVEPDQPPVPGMPAEVWTWLRESMSVRPHVVARVRASLASGDDRPSPDDVALAILAGPQVAQAS